MFRTGTGRGSLGSIQSPPLVLNSPEQSEVSLETSGCTFDSAEPAQSSSCSSLMWSPAASELELRVLLVQNWSSSPAAQGEPLLPHLQLLDVCNRQTSPSCFSSSSGEKWRIMLFKYGMKIQDHQETLEGPLTLHERGTLIWNRSVD